MTEILDNETPHITIPNINGDEVSIPLMAEKPIFVIGPNGCGKTHLLDYLVHHQLKEKCLYLPGHRYNTFGAAEINFSQTQKVADNNRQKLAQAKDEAAWKEIMGSGRFQAVLVDFLTEANDQELKIAKASRNRESGMIEKLIAEPRLLDLLNEKFTEANLSITLHINNGKLLASKNDSAKYSISKLSDGERNAVFISCFLLSAPKNTIVLLDEPERHLHHSISMPLISRLIRQRSDLKFVILTHDLQLVEEFSQCPIIFLRDFQYAVNKKHKWDVHFQENSETIPLNLKASILGGQKKILFIEGEDSSLDNAIYSIFLPNVKIVPVGSYMDVIKQVKSANSQSEMTWIKVRGLIDGDGLENDNTSTNEPGVYRLGANSVEGLYLNMEIFTELAANQAKQFDDFGDLNTVKQQFLNDAKQELQKNQADITHHIIERQMRAQIFDKIPKLRDLDKTNSDLNISVDIQKIIQEVENKYNSAIENNTISDLLNFIPIRRSGLLTVAAKILKYRSHHDYCSAARRLMREDQVLRQKISEKIQPLIDSFDNNT